MKDFRNRIKDRADILNLFLNEDKLEELNKWVNDSIERGVHEFNALDYVYLRLRKEKDNK